MSAVKTYRTTPRTVRALQFVLGQTTKAELLEFVPGANIGVPDTDVTGTDIRWCIVSTGMDTVDEVLDLDYLAWDEYGQLGVYTPERFEQEFNEVTDIEGV